MKGKKTKIISLMLTIVMCASILPMTIVNAAVEPVFSDDFNAATTTWYKDPLLVLEEDGTGNMMTIEGETADRCSMKGVTALTSGLYEFSFDFKPALNTKSWFNIFNGSSLYHTLIAAIPDDNGKLTFLTGRYASDNTPAARIATGMEKGKWYKVKAVIDAGAKKVVSVELITESGVSYTHGEYAFDAYATTWKTGTQIDRIAIHTGAQSTTDRPYIDNVVIQEYKAPFELADASITILDNDGNISTDWNAVIKESNQINIDFGKEMAASDLTTDNIVIENVTAGSTVPYTATFVNNTYKISLSTALIPENTYKVTVKKGMESTDGYVLSEDKVITFVVAKSVEVTDSVFSDDFDAATTTWYKDPLLVPEEDGTGNMMTIEGETADRCSMKGVTALTSGLYEFSFDFKPASNTKSWFNIFNGSSLYHTLIAAIPDDNGKLTFLTGRYASDVATARIATGLEAGKWYKVKAVIDAGAKKVVSVELITESGASYTHGEYAFDAYATTWKTGTQIDRIAIYTGAQSTTDRPYIDNVLIREYKYSISIDDNDFTIYDVNGAEQEDWTNVSASTKTIEIDFGKDMVESELTTNSIVVKDLEGKAVAYTGSYADQVYTISFNNALTEGMTYTVKVNAGLQSEEGYMVNSSKTIEFTVALPEPEEDVVLGDNFNYISSSDCKWYKDKLIVAEEDGTGGMLTIGGTNNDKAAQLGVAPALTSGMYEISYKFKPSITTPTFLVVMNGSALYHTIVSAIPDGAGTVTLQTGRPSDANQARAIIESGMPVDAWYSVKAVVDISRKRIVTVSITDKYGNEYTHAGYAFDTYAATWKTGTQIDRISFNGTATSETDRPYLEDLLVKEYYQTPELGADSVVLYAGDTVQEDYQNVNPLTNKITLDFGTGMDETTINNENIKIVDKDSNNVAVTLSYADRVCTITLPQGLAPNSEYTLSVSGAVLNKKGTAILNPYNLAFKTTKATLKAPITGIKLSGTEVTALSQLAKDNELVIEFDYENSTNEPVELYVIVAYFSGNEMKSVSFIPKEFAADVLMGAQTATHTVKDLTGIDLIRVMVWDGLDTLHPLSPYVDIDNIQ